MSKAVPIGDPVGMDTKLKVDPEKRRRATERLLEIVDRLRDPGGCPWDRKQSPESMAPHAVEEVHELREAIEENDDRAVAEEAGDALMAIAMILRIGSETGRFDWSSACDAVSDKLVRRHPHVFGDKEAKDAGQVVETWEEIKKKERADRESDTSALAGIPKSLSALHKANRICEKSVAAGFAWEGVQGALAKVREEVSELEEAMQVSGGSNSDEAASERIEQELGDVLMATAFLAQYLGLDAERMCNRALTRFESRFRAMEAGFDGNLKGRSLDELMGGWERAKVSTQRDQESR